MSQESGVVESARSIDRRYGKRYWRGTAFLSGVMMAADGLAVVIFAACSLFLVAGMGNLFRVDSRWVWVMAGLILTGRAIWAASLAYRHWVLAAYKRVRGVA